MENVKSEKKRRVKLESDHQSKIVTTKEKVHDLQVIIQKIVEEAERLRNALAVEGNQD